MRNYGAIAGVDIGLTRHTQHGFSRTPIATTDFCILRIHVLPVLRRNRRYEDAGNARDTRDARDFFRSMPFYILYELTEAICQGSVLN